MPTTTKNRAGAGQQIITEDGKVAGGGMFVNRTFSKDEISTGFDFDPSLTEQVRAVYDEQFGSIAHDMWRAPRALPAGGYDPRVKPDGLGGEVDIANTDYRDLPLKWKEETYSSVKVAVDALIADPEASVDDGAETVHDEWVARNREWADPALTVPYSELPEHEKQKDRDYVVIAMAALEQVKNG